MVVLNSIFFFLFFFFFQAGDGIRDPLWSRGLGDVYKGQGPSASDGTWQEPVSVGPRNGNCPEGYPVVETNEVGTVAAIWADCPDGGTGPWDMLSLIHI